MNMIPNWQEPAFIVCIRPGSLELDEPEDGEGFEYTYPGYLIAPMGGTTTSIPGRATRYCTHEAATAALHNYMPDGPDEGEPRPKVVEYIPSFRNFDGTPAMFLNVYELDRVYGGPEEGGWWYDAGHRVACVPVPRSVTAEYLTDQLRTMFPPEPVHGPPLHSVNYSGGAYEIRIDFEPGELDYPRNRPHYE